MERVRGRKGKGEKGNCILILKQLKKEEAVW